MEYYWQTTSDILQKTLMIILITELIIGNLGNGFLAWVNCINWVRRKKISFVNQILTAMATSRICLLWLLTATFLVSIVYPDLTKPSRLTKVMAIAWIIVNHFSIWLATCLGVFYFLKTSNFSNPLFLYLKWRAEKAVSGTLLVSLFLLFVNILLINLEVDVCVNESQRNISDSFYSLYNAQCHRHVLFLHIIFLSIPFCVCLSSLFLLIFSLWTHHKRMQQHVQRYTDARTTVHIKALQVVIPFLLLYTIFIFCLLIQLWKYELLEKNVFILFCQVMYIAFPSFHSCVLILSDIKLRQASLSLCCGT